MLRKIMFVFISLFLMATLIGCNNDTDASTGNTTLFDKSEISSGSFSSQPFSNISEGDILSDEKIQNLIANVPSDKYETYPDTQNMPISAILYKDGKEISIELDDERLIKLTNFFNNCVYYSKCAYTQGLLSTDYIEEYVTGCDFRLELKFVPYGEIGPSPYGTCTTMCDTIIITDDFTLMAHDLPGYEGQSDTYPFRAVGFYPLYDEYNWLELFGF